MENLADLDRDLVVTRIVFEPQVIGERQRDRQKVFHGSLAAINYNEFGDKVGSSSGCPVFATTEKQCKLLLQAKVPMAVETLLALYRPLTHEVMPLKSYGLCA